MTRPANPGEAAIEATLERLNALHPKVIDLSLGRIRGLLDKLGNPHEALPPVIHVAGTNGKGSLIAILGALLGAAGYRVHAFTSPHLVHFHERITLAGHYIADDRLAALLDEVEAVNDGAEITFFELITAAAFLAFAREPADLLLLETGLGGRLDATNVVAAPALTAITRISMDHRDFLGHRIESIAREKAGILKPGVPAVLYRQPSPEAHRTVLAQAERMGAPCHVQDRDWRVWARGEHLLWRGEQGEALTLPVPALAGAHQVDNAGMALACLERLAPDFTVSEADMAAGLAEVRWPARLQRLTQGPLAEMLPAGWELWLDGGHNDSAGEALAAQARAWGDRPLGLICGMVRHKDPRPFLAPLAGRVRRLEGVAIEGAAEARAGAEIAAAATEMGLAPAEAADSLTAALARLVETAQSGGPERVLICGSLYMAGHVLARHG